MIEDKINKLDTRIETIDKRVSDYNAKIKELTAQKKTLEKQRDELLEEQILSCIREQKIAIKEVKDNLEIGAIIKGAGLTRSDIISLISPAPSGLDFGGDENEIAE